MTRVNPDGVRQSEEANRETREHRTRENNKGKQQGETRSTSQFMSDQIGWSVIRYGEIRVLVRFIRLLGFQGPASKAGGGSVEGDQRWWGGLTALVFP